MSRKKKFDTVDVSGEIGAALADLGFVFEVEFDNRHGKRASRYICIRKPFAAKIRISDHRSNWMEQNAQRSRILMLDVGPHALTAEAALNELRARSPTP